jgi:hypothetical protein
MLVTGAGGRRGSKRSVAELATVTRRLGLGFGSDSGSRRPGPVEGRREGTLYAVRRPGFVVARCGLCGLRI